MTEWGACSSIQIVSTIQSSQTGETVRARKEAVSAGIFDGIVRFSRSPEKPAVSWAYCGLPSPRSKIPFPAAGFPQANTLGILQNLGVLGRRIGPPITYPGFNPRASNCRLHSAGASRSRSTPRPRGKRPSTAALTKSGARNASEIVILTWRTLHFCRAAIR
jgi:hypothetical protein